MSSVLSLVTPVAMINPLPMETLPHWETVVEPSVLELIGVILGVPIVIALLITLVNWAPNLARLARGGRHGGHGSFWINPGSLRPAGIDTGEDEAPYTVGERESLVRAVRRAEDASGLEFSVYLGAAEGKSAEDFAIDLLDSLPEPERSVLLFWDPQSGALEFVTGDEADRVLDAGDIAQARAEVLSSAENDPAAGVEQAINLLGVHARTPKVLHTDPSLAVTAH